MSQLLPVTVGLHALSEFATVPTYGTSQAACFDLYACTRDREFLTVIKPDNSKMKVPVVLGRDVKEDKVIECHSIMIRPKERLLVPTGLVFDIPEGYSMRLHGRSGLALKYDVVLANCEGIVDSDYTEQTQIMIKNNSDVSFIFNHGDRLCQAEIVEDLKVTFELLEVAIEQKGDRAGGFGHTGS